VPVCFPQFGQLGPLGQHGFARNTKFDVLEETADSATLVRHWQRGATLVVLQGSSAFNGTFEVSAVAAPHA
jgi:D-hexose-6-phosphate mutarotase